MTHLESNRGQNEPNTNQLECQIQIKGHLPESWSDWFDGFSLTQQPNGVTVITGTFVDQAALFGMLWRIRDLGLPLLSIYPVQIKNKKKTKEKNHE